jgi:hypothetical protein
MELASSSSSWASSLLKNPNHCSLLLGRVLRLCGFSRKRIIERAHWGSATSLSSGVLGASVLEPLSRRAPASQKQSKYYRKKPFKYKCCMHACFLLCVCWCRVSSLGFCLFQNLRIFSLSLSLNPTTVCKCSEEMVERMLLVSVNTHRPREIHNQMLSVFKD